MQKLSIVIVCKNEAKEIGNTLTSFNGLTDNIIIYDNGSTDGTQKIVSEFGVDLQEGDWEGFGKTKNKANALGKYDWILSLDADESIDEQLKNNLLQLDLSDENKIYEFRFKTFLGNKWLKFGVWRTDSHVRLYNRKHIQWNNNPVHESLIIPETHRSEIVKGFVLHRTAANAKEYEFKMINYALLTAENYYKKGKRAGTMKKYLASYFSFIKNFIFRFGFLDGWEGLDCARIFAAYTYLKYEKLQEMTNSK
jgi:glycosyltransferase involved in cell wall biosynthesis